jgi:hypothetical protein
VHINILEAHTSKSLQHYNRGLPHISNVASQSNESVENLFNHWDEIRIHYKANIENAPPKLAETDKGAHETMSQSLDDLAKHERRAL